VHGGDGIFCSRRSTVPYLTDKVYVSIVTVLVFQSINIFFSQVAVCNLASIAVNMFVNSDRTYDFGKLKDIAKIITRNLNKIIDINYYPVPEVSYFIGIMGEFFNFSFIAFF
jgi:ribonucleotide reductase alpha subunit